MVRSQGRKPRFGGAAIPGAAGRPLTLWLVFAPVSLAVYLLHLTLLRLPYFWDEGGYYIPAAWDFFRLRTLIPETTIRNAHPPLPSILLAGWWTVAGFHVVSTRIFVCLVASAALVGVFRLARLLAGETAAWTVLVLTAVYPVWFSQSTLAHADVFAAAFSLWGLSFYVERARWVQPEVAAGPQLRCAIAAGVLFSLAALSKETAVVLPAGLFCYEAWVLWEDRGPQPWFRSASATPVRNSGQGAHTRRPRLSAQAGGGPSWSRWRHRWGRSRCGISTTG